MGRTVSLLEIESRAAQILETHAYERVENLLALVAALRSSEDFFGHAHKGLDNIDLAPQFPSVRAFRVQSWSSLKVIYPPRLGSAARGDRIERDDGT